MPLGSITGEYNWRKRQELPEVQEALNALGIEGYTGKAKENTQVEDYILRKRAEELARRNTVVPPVAPTYSEPAKIDYRTIARNANLPVRMAVAGEPYSGEDKSSGSRTMPSYFAMEDRPEYNEPTMPQSYLESKPFNLMPAMQAQVGSRMYGPYQAGTAEDLEMVLDYWNDPIARAYNRYANNNVMEVGGRGNPRYSPAMWDVPGIMNREFEGPLGKEFRQKLNKHIKPGDPYCAATGMTAIDDAAKQFGMCPEDYMAWQQVRSPMAVAYASNAKRHPQEFAVREFDEIPSDPGFVIEDYGGGRGHTLYGMPDRGTDPTGYYFFQGNSAPWEYDEENDKYNYIKPEGVNWFYKPIETNEYGERNIPNFPSGAKHISLKANRPKTVTQVTVKKKRRAG